MLLEHDLAPYVGLMVLGCLAIGVMALALERRMPPAANGVAGDVEPALTG